MKIQKESSRLLKRLLEAKFDESISFTASFEDGPQAERDKLDTKLHQYQCRLF